MSVSAEDEGLRIEIENGVAALTLDMPSTRNAFGSEVAAEFTQFFKDANTRQDVRSILIRSTGDRDFCLGGAASRKPTAPPRTTLEIGRAHV